MYEIIFQKRFRHSIIIIICVRSVVREGGVVVGGMKYAYNNSRYKIFFPLFFLSPRLATVSNSNHVLPVKNLGLKVLPAGLVLSYRNMIYCPTLFENLTKRNLFISSYYLFFFPKTFVSNFQRKNKIPSLR